MQGGSKGSHDFCNEGITELVEKRESIDKHNIFFKKKNHNNKFFSQEKSEYFCLRGPFPGGR